MFSIEKINKMNEEATKAKKCRHSNPREVSWSVFGACAWWCNKCGAFKQLNCNWEKPTNS
jgi:hypothetical protein